ncbi:MAG: tetratricopeptide repeat protein, partial [Rhodocyclaceae bacterium]
MTWVRRLLGRWSAPDASLHRTKWWLKPLGRWGAEYFYLAAVKQKAAAGDPEAAQELAREALARGEIDAAERLIRKALAAQPANASHLVTLAAVLRRREDMTAAREALQRALAVAPGHARALTNLAEIDLLQGDAAAALAKLDAALAAEPGLLPAQVNRVAALSELGRHEEARALGEKLLARHGEHPELLLNTANALLQLGRGRKAAELLRKALTARPNFPEASYLLAVLVGDFWALYPALDYLEKRLAREGESLSLLNVLASGHQAAGNLSRAREIAIRMLEREPGHVNAMMLLASCSSSCGHAEIADRFYGDLFRRSNDLAGMASNWLFEGNYLPHLPPEALYARHRDWARRYESSPPNGQPLARRHLGPLRIGYVSGDLCRHPVGQLLLQIILQHDRSAFRTIAFSTTLREDDMTLTLKDAFHAWHDVFDDDDALMKLIQKEEIDILVDLAGHTAFHRLTVFARRAAPVQVSWIGYFHSTGLDQIDYLLTDPHTSPVEVGQFFSETPIYLGSTRFCFFPPRYAPDVAPPPSARGQPFTFGCFNRLAKLNDEV